MTYVAGAIAGILLGGIIGYLKSVLIWKKYIQKATDAQAGQNDVSVYTRAIISNFVNLVTLVGVFLLRNLVPFDGIAFLIGTALSLAVVNQVLAMRQKKAAEKKGKEDCTE